MGLVVPDALTTKAAAALRGADVAHAVLGEPGDVEEHERL